MNRISIPTQFVGQQWLYYPVCPSTNTEALRLVNENKVQQGAIVITDHQTAGRGQRDNTWEAAPGQNLTFSIVLYPALPVTLQYHLSIMASLAVTDALHACQYDRIQIKWPNDIFYLDNKVCGILIQNNLKNNKIQSVVVGIGINVNQMHFSNPKATSLSLIQGKTVEREEILSKVLYFLEKRYRQLENRAVEYLEQDYLKNMYWINESHQFADPSGVFDGIIRGINAYGQLLVETGGDLRSYGLKEIRYVS